MLLNPSNEASWNERKNTIASLAMAIPNTRIPSFASLDMLNSTPIAKSKRIAPISENSSTVSLWETKARKLGPTKAPISSKPSTGGTRKRFARTPAIVANRTRIPTSTNTAILFLTPLTFLLQECLTFFSV